jgi:hypothetical protein
MLIRCIQTLVNRNILTDKNPDEEMAALAKQLGETYGRDPIDLLEHYRRYWQQGSSRIIRQERDSTVTSG